MPDQTFSEELYDDTALKDAVDRMANLIKTHATKSFVNSEVEKKQDKLTFDNTPTVSSTNPVTSAGIHAALQEFADTKTPVIYGSASGPIASFKDGADDLPMKSAVVTMDPIQDLHGYDNPWSAGGGKNKFNPKKYNETISGVNIVSDGSGMIVFSGTSTGAFWYRVDRGGLATPEPLVLPSGEYIISASGIPSNQVYVRFNDGADHDLTVNDPSYTFTSDGTTALVINIRVQNNIAFGSGTSICIMIRLATETNATFAPYENICPISGRTGVSVTHVGKNILPPKFDGSENGLVFTTQTDGSVKVNGTATATINKTVIMYIPEGDYALNGCPLDGSASTYQMWISSIKTGSSTGIEDRGSGSSGHLDAGMHSVRIRIASGYTANDLTFYPMLRVAGSDSNYEPYKGSTYAVNWETEAGTVYGGTLDVVSGKLTVTHEGIVLNGSENWEIVSGNYPYFRLKISTLDIAVPTKSICDRFPRIVASSGNNYQGYSAYYSAALGGGTFIGLRYNDAFSSEDIDSLKTWLSQNNTTVVYELLEPTEIQLTPQEIRTFLGVNDIWSDGGDVEVEYPADTKTYIDTKIAEAVAAALA